MERRVCTEPLSLETKKRFDRVSPEAKDLLNGLLEKSPEKRLSIDEVTRHPWFSR